MEILSTLSDAKEIFLPALIVVLVGSVVLLIVQITRLVRFYRMPKEERKKYIWM